MARRGLPWSYPGLCREKNHAGCPNMAYPGMPGTPNTNPTPYPGYCGYGEERCRGGLHRGESLHDGLEWPGVLEADSFYQ